MGAKWSLCFQSSSVDDNYPLAAASSAVTVTRSGTVRDARRDRTSVYYDAKESATASMLYVPTSYPKIYTKGSVAMDDPKTLLGVMDKKGVGKFRQTMVVKSELRDPKVNVEMRGYPGALTEEELEICLTFRKALQEESDPEYRAMVGSFCPVEEEPYALCRFLRSRSFVVDEVLEMIATNLEHWKWAKGNDFFPTIESAVRCPASVFVKQFPYFYHGNAKNGCPVQYFLAGQLDVDGLECVTDLSNIPRYVWHSTMYMFKAQVGTGQASNPDAVRCESVQIIDLKGLRASQLNRKTVSVLQEISKQTGSFPEFLNHLVILNAPSFFSLSWRIIKGFLTPTTVAKIEIFTDEKKGKQRLLQMIDKRELLSDYGGDGPSFHEVAQKASGDRDVIREIAELITMNGKANSTINLAPHENASIVVYSRTEAATVSLLKQGEDTNQVILAGSKSGEPYRTEIGSFEGPAELKLTAKTASSEKEYLLVYVKVFPQTPS